MKEWIKPIVLELSINDTLLDQDFGNDGMGGGDKSTVS